jgi:hypothetical protein
MGRLAVTALYSWMALCYFALVRTVLLPLLPASPLLLGAGFVGFTGLLALVLSLHVLLLRSSPGFVPSSWMPPLEPPGQKKGQQRPLITAVETIPARSETSSVEVVVLQASTHEPLDASGNESLMATSLEGTQDMNSADDDNDDDDDERQWKDFCIKCSSPRPPRARHCRVCNRCVLKMDHHCPWINNCVGNNNFKLFFLFLCAASLLGLSSCLLFLLGGFHFWQQWNDMPQDFFWWDGALLLVNWWLSMAATAHIAMMAGHMYVNMTENATTIEQISLGSRRPKPRNPYDLGREENMRQVMGEGVWERWLSPLTLPTSDGFSFPTRHT